MEDRPDPRIAALPDIHGHAKGEHKTFAEERPIPYTARMLFLWFFHACRRSSPRFLMVADHMNYLTFEDPAAVNLVRRALKLAQAGDLYGAAETAGVELGHAAVVSDGLRRGMRYSIGAEIDNDPRCRPDAQNIVDAMKPDGMIRSIHFLSITHPQHGDHWMWAFDNPEFKDLYDVVGPATVWEIYMTTLLDAVEKLPGNIVGHFYVPAKFGHWPEDEVLESYENRFVAACAERGMAIEINSRYFYKYYVGDEAQLARYRNAHLRLLRKAKAAGVMIAVGSDAHSPKDQGRAFDSVLALLDEADVNEIAFPIAGRLARVALRATEEVLREHTAALAPPPAQVALPQGAGPGGDDAQVAASATAAPDEPRRSVDRPARSRAKPPAAASVTATHEAAATGSLTASPAQPDRPAKKRSHKKGGTTTAAMLPPADTVTTAAEKTAEAPKPPEARPEAKAARTGPKRVAGSARRADTAAQGETRRSRLPKKTAAASPKKAMSKSASTSTAKGATGRKRASRPTKFAAKTASSVKSARTKAAPAKKAAKKMHVKAPQRSSSVKKLAAKPASRASKKAAKRAAPAKKTSTKGTKRSAPAKTAAKKGVAKKTGAKKKASRTRR